MLQQISDGTMTASYKYNDGGLRTEKTVNGVTTEYSISGNLLTWEKTGSNAPIYYLYDDSGILWGLNYNGNIYFYVQNLQNDVIGLVDSTGTLVVEYAYDAWGNILNTIGTLASTLGEDNPFRYRGYYYDQETGLYYLQSRYYNPETARYINADVYVSTGQGLLSGNMFAYCFNNPVNHFDDGGMSALPNWAKIAIGVATTVAAVALTVATAGAAAPIIATVVASTALGAGIGAVTHRVKTGGWEGAGKAALDGASDGFMWGVSELLEVP